MDKEKLKEAEDFYRDRILGWMVNDLKKSITANTNFLTALGCLTYTEIIGIFLPKLDQETGSKNEKRFYRCFFRLNSHRYLKELDNFIRKETNNKGIYPHLRHSMAHKYFPAVSKREKNVYLSIPSIVARDGITVDKLTGKQNGSPPIFLSDNRMIAIATKNYANELEAAVNEFIDTTFNKNNIKFQLAAVNGIDVVLKGKE